MSHCHSCGGVIGRDCWNPQECAEITERMAIEQSQPDPAPSNANTSGLEVVAWRWRFRTDGVWNYQEAQQRIPDVTCEPLVTAASAQARIAKLEADAVRSEKHRNDLADKITSQSIELGALRSRINALNADTPHHLVLHDGTDAWCSAAAWKWFQAWSVRADEEASRATAAEARADRLAKALEPFAVSHECDGHATVEDFNMEVQIFVRWEAIKSARAALQQETQP